MKESLHPIVSIDIPSGWEVEVGSVNDDCIVPTMLVSLTAPKTGCRAFKGIHYLGGRFMTTALQDQFELEIPEFPGSDQCVKLM